MALNFNIPSSPRTYTIGYKDFLGVDLNNSLDMDVRHSPNMYNMINRFGYLKKRYGVKIKLHVDSAPIYGIYQYDINDSTVPEVLIVHCGSKLYEVSTDFTVKTQIMSGLAENKSFGMFLGDKLVILDGLRAIIYGEYNGSYSAQYMDEVAYAPTTSIGRNPDGTGATAYEAYNLLSQYRINEFLANGTDVDYYTDSTTISPNYSDITIWILSNDTGLWEELAQSAYTLDNSKIRFTTAPEAPIVEGRDNVRIYFKSTDEDNSDLINKCTICTAFGYEGNNQRLFYSGNPDKPNGDWHSYLVDSQPDPTYVSDESFTIIGTEPIIGYLRLADGVLAVLKKLSDTDCSIYYRTSTSQNTYDLFPLLSGTKNVGCLNYESCLNVKDYAVFLSDDGIYQMVTSEASSSLERYADNKSYFVNPALIKEENLEEAKAVVVGDLYYLFVNDNVYVGDTSRLTENKNVKARQYQWYIYNNIPCSAVMRWNNDLLMGDKNGYLKMFGTDYIDELTSSSEETVHSYFESMPLDFSLATQAKTTRNFIFNYIVSENTKFNFGYKTIDSEEVISEEIFKCISGTLSSDTSEEIIFPYGTKLNFENIIPETEDDFGFSGYYYGNQTDDTKTIFGIYKESGGDLSIGIYTIKNFGTPEQTLERTKTIFANGEYELTSMTLKKALSGSIDSVATDISITPLTFSNWSFENVYLSNSALNNMPQTLMLKEKARKIMFLKFFVESDENYACEFDRFYVEYRRAGKYRGE